jgi:hypothetical protein
MADGNFLATYLKIGVDYEFDIKTAKFNYNLLKTCGSYRNPLLSKVIFRQIYFSQYFLTEGFFEQKSFYTKTIFKTLVRKPN